MGGIFPLIEAMLAFALTMFLLATATSAVVGAAARLTRVRARNLRKTVDFFYRHDVVPGLASRGEAPLGNDRSGNPLPIADEAARARFVADMTLLPNSTAATSTRESYLPQLPVGSIMPDLALWHDLGRSLDALPESEFRERFSSSAAGAALLATPGTPPPVSLDDLARKFSVLSAATGESVARRLRPWHVIASFVLVLLLKVDAIELVKTYARDPELTLKVIETTLPRVKAAPSAAEAGPPATASGTQADQAVEVEMAELRTHVRVLLDGLPIGGAGYPFCAQGNGDTRCPEASRTAAKLSQQEDSRQELANLSGILPPHPTGRWLLGWFLTSIMVGLGTTVWMQAVNGLLKGRELIKNKPGGQTEPAP